VCVWTEREREVPCFTIVYMLPDGGKIDYNSQVTCHKNKSFWEQCHQHDKVLHLALEAYFWILVGGDELSLLMLRMDVDWRTIGGLCGSIYSMTCHLC
jgi:hypothetical protein